MNIPSLFHGTLGTITLVVILFILCLFVYALIRVWTKTRRITNDCDSLIFPASHEDLSKTKIGRMLLENDLGQTSDYIEDAISTQGVAAGYKLNLRLMQAVPSILTSLGILGTFIGLSVSVLMFNTASSESIRTSIETLLAGMGTAFFTSVVGMVFSLIFLMIERVLYNKICNSVDSLCSRINKQYHRPSGALLDAGLEKISNKIDEMQHSFGDNLDKVFADKLTPVMTDISRQIDCLQHSFGDNLDRVFDNKLTPVMTDISRQIDGLQLTFGNDLDKVFDEKVTPVITEISHKLENPARTIADSLLVEFKKLSDSFADRLTEKVNNKMNELLEQFVLATNEMKGVPDAINTATENLIKAGELSISAQKEFTKEAQTHFEKYTEGLTNAVNSATENLIRSGEATIDAQKEFTKETQSRFEKYTEDLTNAVKGQLSEIQQQLESASGALKGIPEEINQSVEAQKTVTEEFSQQIAKLGSIEEIYSAAIEKITAANHDLADAKSNIGTLTTKIANVAKSIENASNGMVDSTEKMLADFERINNLNKVVATQVKGYSDRISGIEDGLKGVFAEIEKGLSRYATTSSKNMQGLLDTFTTAVAKASQEISNSTSPLHEAVSGILNALQKTERSANALLARVEKLPQQKANQ